MKTHAPEPEVPLFPRSCGLLLHPTCLAGPDGIGDLGAGAEAFLRWLHRHGQSVWQILPLGPTSFGDSPYQTLSALAGNTLLISLDLLAADGWLTAADLARRPQLPAARVDFGAVIAWKSRMLERAWESFAGGAGGAAREEFTSWRAANAPWLEDFALFMALKGEHGGRPWVQWDADLAARRRGALEAARRRLDRDLSLHAFCQWVFFRQWGRIKELAGGLGIRIVGDIPIFVAHDSSDVWARQELFRLDERGRPLVVAGVPPDYFSATGQLWGNPLYDWRAMKADRYRWWVQRVGAALACVDAVRLDHFRGFEACWEVPAGAPTAEGGRWVPGPGARLLKALQAALGGRLPVIAEDLGVITPAVDDLRRRFALPGMKVLQFAWSGPDNLFLPHEHEPNAVVYCGTHDNDPTNAWWEHLADERTRALVAEYAGAPVSEPNWTLIRLGMMSCAHTFIATMPDVLGLGREARLNLPGDGRGNWAWRLPPGALEHEGGERLARLAWLYRRRPEQAAPRHATPARPDPERLR